MIGRLLYCCAFTILATQMAIANPAPSHIHASHQAQAHTHAQAQAQAQTQTPRQSSSPSPSPIFLELASTSASTSTSSSTQAQAQTQTLSAPTTPGLPPLVDPTSLLSAMGGVDGMGGGSLGVGSGMLLGGYIPENTPFSAPDKSLQAPTPIIPSSPDCSVRPQTIVEIQRMRETATSIAQSVQREVIIMNRRKAYIEQMTAYLNDRIRELNKVKSELAEEARWITVSHHRIEELAEREKLVKYQDILACLNTDQHALTGEKSLKEAALKSMKEQNEKVLSTIKEIQGKIEAATKDEKPPPAATA